MWLAEDERQLRGLIERTGVNSVLIDTGFNSDEILEVIKKVDAFDAHSKQFWHLIVPSKTTAVRVSDKVEQGYIDIDYFSTSDLKYNHAYAKDVASQLNIDVEDMPCVVFFGCDQSDYIVYPLGDREKWTKDFYAIANIISSFFEKQAQIEPEALRKELLGEVRAYLTEKYLLKSAGNVGGIFARLLNVGAAGVTVCEKIFAN